MSAQQQVEHHLIAARRHFERGEYKKAEQQFLSAQQVGTANGVYVDSRLHPAEVHKRNAIFRIRERERALKDGNTKTGNDASAEVRCEGAPEIPEAGAAQGSAPAIPASL